MNPNCTNLDTAMVKGVSQLHSSSDLPARNLSDADQLHYKLIQNNIYTEVDGLDISKYSISTSDITFTVFSQLTRIISLIININLALDYRKGGENEYFIWTTICIVVPMCIISLLYMNMSYRDGKFNNGSWSFVQALLVVLITSFLCRDLSCLIYSIKCRCAENRKNKDAQLKYYRLTIREESDVTFLRLFESFLETAPQKILLISIVLRQFDEIETIKIIAICLYFFNIAWSLASYHRQNRCSQVDKELITKEGRILQLFWHFCISVSRTLCIAFIASIYPFGTIIFCACHAVIFGIIAYISDRPPFATLPVLNFLFCLIVGVVYIYTYMTLRDTPTRWKYSIYYTICIAENIICVCLFFYHISGEYTQIPIWFYPICTMAVLFYFVGIIFMIIYYLNYHPNITLN